MWMDGCPSAEQGTARPKAGRPLRSPLQAFVSVSAPSHPSSPPICQFLPISAVWYLAPPPPRYDLVSFLLDKSVVSVVIYRGVIFFSSFSPSSYCDHSKPCSCPVPTSRYQPFYHCCLDICTIDLTANPAAECHTPSPVLRVCERACTSPRTLSYHDQHQAYLPSSSVSAPLSPPFLSGVDLDSL